MLSRRCRLPRAGETGAHLSGGLDSSALSVLAARQLREQGRTLHAYSFLDRQRNDVTLEDESDFVKAVLEQEGDIDWTPVRPPGAAPASDDLLEADKMTPLRDDDPENTVCARAEEQGVGLILSGWGGDEAQPLTVAVRSPKCSCTVTGARLGAKSRHSRANDDGRSQKSSTARFYPISCRRR